MNRRISRYSPVLSGLHRKVNENTRKRLQEKTILKINQHEQIVVITKTQRKSGEKYTGLRHVVEERRCNSNEKKRGWRHHSHGNSNTAQWTGAGENRARPNLPIEFGICPLRLEVESLTKVKLSHLIENKLLEVQVTNIHADKTNFFTIYVNDVKSFNQILNDLTLIIQPSENRTSTIYIPRSIQRILENNKEAFVKRVDLEITQEDMKNALQELGLKHENIYRLINKDKLPTKTVKITSTDPSNRDLCVKYGLQIE